MDGSRKDQRIRAGFRGLWGEGVGPVLVAVVLALGVAATIDLIDGRQEKPKAAKKAAVAKQAVKRPSVPGHVVAVRKSGSAVVVRDATSGAGVGVSVSAPQGRRFHQVAPGGNGSYVVSSYASGRVLFHRLVLDGTGRPQEIVPIPGVLVPGVSTARSDLAVSAKGDRIAYVTYRGSKGRVQIVTVATGERRSWTTNSPGLIGSLSWGGDTLSFVWSPAGKGPAGKNPAGKGPAGKGGQRQVRALDTTAPGGDLGASRVALKLPAGSATAVLSGDGKTIVTGLRDASEVSVEAFSAVTGRRTKVLWVRKTTGAGGLAGLSRDSTGTHLLAAGTDGRIFVGSISSPQNVLELPADDLSDVVW